MRGSLVIRADRIGASATLQPHCESLIAVAPIFGEKPFFMSDEFTLVDCCVAPLLWRLPLMDISLPPRQTKAMQDYMSRLFDRDGFRASLTEPELEMRD